MAAWKREPDRTMDSAPNLIARARTLAARGEARQALDQAARATDLEPDSADAWKLHGLLSRRLGRLNDARDSLAHAHGLLPDDVPVTIEYAGVLEQLEDHDRLLEVLDGAISRQPDSTRLHLSRARTLASLGDFRASREDYRCVIGLDPDHVEAVCALVHAGFGKDAGGLAGIDALLAGAEAGSDDEFRLLYARARLLDQAAEHDAAFEAYAEANRKQAARGGMDIGAKQRAAVTVLDDLGPAVVQRHSGRGHPSRRPVFIVGMPRSGTSLTEQILSRHPDIHAIGEQTYLGEVLRDLITAAPQTGGRLADAIGGLPGSPWHDAGAEYLRRMDEIDSEANRITDKLPANFALLPWIRLILPQARILHVRRHPMATLASCIRTPFADNLLSFTVENWARFYGLYEALMSRWQPLMGDCLLEVRYEDLVSDLPGQVQRLLDFLGLDWHDACLQPERARRAVRTASQAQVRQGVHGESVDKWRRYERQLLALKPLIRESREAVAGAVTE